MAAGLVEQAQQPMPAGAPTGEMPAGSPVGAAPQAPPVSAAPQAPQAPQAPPEDVGGEEPNLTPEEQKTYDSAMQMVGELLYTSDEGYEAVMSLIKPDDPALSIATASTFVLSKIEETFDGNYPEELVITTADEISDLIIELVSESGAVAMDEQVAKEVKMELIDLLAQDYGADPADIEQALGAVTEGDLSEMKQTLGVPNG